MSNLNPFSVPEPWSLVANGYNETTRHFLSQYCETVLQKAQLNHDMYILDLGCGPGTLSLLATDDVQAIDAVDFSMVMIEQLKENLIDEGIVNVEPIIADGQNLPHNANSFDAAFSMFSLIFFPDRIKGLRELNRVLKPGCCAYITAWAPITDSPAMKLMFDAISYAMPDMPKPSEDITSLENPDVFKDEMQKSGFTHVHIQPCVHQLTAQSPAELWNFMVKGSVPIVMIKETMPPAQWAKVETKIQRYLKENLPEGPVSLPAKAWIGIGQAG